MYSLPVRSATRVAATPTDVAFNAARLLFAVLLSASIVLPTMLQPVKLALLAAIVLCLLAPGRYWARPAGTSQLALEAGAVCYAMIGLVWGLIGLVRGTPGASAMLTVHVAYPLLAALLSRLAQPGDWWVVSRLLIFAIVGVLLSQALFIGSFFGIDGGLFFDWFVRSLNEDTAVVDASGDYLLFTLPSVSSLLFMAPWLCLFAIFGERRRVSSAILALLVIAGLMLAGRRVALLALAGGMAVGLVAARPLLARSGDGENAGRALWRLTGLMLALAGMAVVGFASGVLSADLLAERAASVFDFSGDNESNLARRLQYDALMAGIAAHPLLGNGLGAAASYIRSDDQPWAYELSYIALVFQVGLLGFTLYALGVVYLLAHLAMFASSNLPRRERVAAVCYLGGLVAFLISNATNPYLAKFDYMWVIFIPLGLMRLHHRPHRAGPRRDWPRSIARVP